VNQQIAVEDSDGVIVDPVNEHSAVEATRTRVQQQGNKPELR
jgi:hypothetical protein